MAGDCAQPSTQCSHIIETQAWRYDGETEGGTPFIGHLCGWADAHPDRLANSPRWLSVYALAGGPGFVPAKHCPGCPGFDARRP